MADTPYPPRNLADLPTNVWLIGQEGAGRQQQDRYTPGSLRAHPGKMLPELARRLIEHYTRPGDWVLDPLSGIGTTGVEALHLGRRYVGIELEPRFVHWQRHNLELAGEQAGNGQFALHHADARRLDAAFDAAARTGASPGQWNELTALDGPVDAVITSPPYGHRLRQQRNPTRLMRELMRQGKFGRGVLPGIYGKSEANLGNLKREAYFAGMRHVYTGSYQCLRPGGLLILVLQPQWDRCRLRPLHHETVRLCESLGFHLIDELAAILARISPSLAPSGETTITAHASFWRRLRVAQLRERGWPVTLNQLEYVLVLRKPETRGPRPIPAPPIFPRRSHKSGRQAALAGPASGVGR